jgi:hypothetical protein
MLSLPPDSIWAPSCFFCISLPYLLVLWKYCQTRSQATLREVGELRFLKNFTPVVPMSSYLKFFIPSSKITGFLKGSAGDWITGNLLVANRWTHTGDRDQGCLGRSSRGACFRKAGMESRGSIMGSLFAEGDKERWEWVVILSPHGDFYFGPGPILWLN